MSEGWRVQPLSTIPGVDTRRHIDGHVHQAESSGVRELLRHMRIRARRKERQLRGAVVVINSPESVLAGARSCPTTG